jgi:uncharacterized protein
LISPTPSDSCWGELSAVPFLDIRVRIRVRDIEETTKELVFEEPTSDLNSLLEQGPVRDYQFVGPGTVRVRCYRAGSDLFFAGEVMSAVEGRCARCLASFSFDLPVPFSFVMVPRGGRWTEEETEMEGVDLAHYEGEEVDLSPLLRERILLALPTLPLCAESCRGLCPHCGANLNTERCECVADEGDPRLAVLRDLKVRR